MTLNTNSWANCPNPENLTPTIINNPSLPLVSIVTPSYNQEDKERHQKLCERSREKVEQEFTLELQARRYASLFDKLVIRESG